MTITVLSRDEFFSQVSEVSYHGVEISATASDLIAVLGEVDRQPDYKKCQFHWFLRLEREDGTGIFATLYDWKEYYDFSLDETLLWHVGAATRHDAEAVAEVFQSLLNPSLSGVQASTLSVDASAPVSDASPSDAPSLPTRLRVVVLLPGDGRIDLIDLECEPDDVEATLQEHYGHSFFQYMAAPCEHWYCRHKYINALDECETIKEFTL